MRVVLFLPVVAAVQVIDSQQALDVSRDYEGMKATLKGIAAQRVAGEKIDDATILSVNFMLGVIQGQLMESLNCDRDQAQHQLDQAVANIQACDTTRGTWFSNTQPGYANEVTAKCDFHSACRAFEKGKCETRNTNCDAQDVRVQVINADMCPVPDFSLGDGGKDTTVNNFMNCLHHVVTLRLNAYQQGRQQCRSDCAALAAATAGANRAQGDCEEKVCELEKETQDACCEYRECRFTAEQNYYEVRGIVRTEESVFQTQREGLECLLCYGYGITNATVNYDHCESPDPCETYSDCPTINYPPTNPPVAFQQCTEAADNLPCEQAWIQAEYPNWLGDAISRYNCVPKVTTCTACAARPAEDTCGGEQHKTDSGCEPQP